MVGLINHIDLQNDCEDVKGKLLALAVIEMKTCLLSVTERLILVLLRC